MKQNQGKSLTEIIKACIEGDSLGQKKLYELYFGRMMNICLRYSPDYETASEILNSGFLTIFNKIGSLRNPGSFEGWAKKIMVNKCLDQLRSRKNTFTDFETVDDLEILVETENFKQLSAEEITRMIQMLPDQTRTVFNLFAIEGYSHSEISTMLGISQNTSSWHVNQARKKLRETISKALNE